ncbi:unnamed protein product, partial [Dicrocoelium dendriticum]
HVNCVHLTWAYIDRCFLLMIVRDLAVRLIVLSTVISLRLWSERRADSSATGYSDGRSMIIQFSQTIPARYETRKRALSNTVYATASFLIEVQ